MPSLPRISWTQKRVNAIVLLLSGRSAGSSKLKRLVRVLQAHHEPKVGSGSRLSLVVDGTRRIVVAREDIPQLVYRTFRSPMLGGGRGRDSLYEKLRTERFICVGGFANLKAVEFKWRIVSAL